MNESSKWATIDARVSGIEAEDAHRRDDGTLQLPAHVSHGRALDAPQTGPGAFLTQRKAKKEIREAQLARLGMVLKAELAHDKARLELELTKAIAKIRDEWLAFMGGLELQQLQRRLEVARELEELTKNELLALAARDMPDFMRDHAVDAIVRHWKSRFNMIMRDDFQMTTP